MTLEINMDDFWMRTLKKSCSYNQVTPPGDLTTGEYLAFLEYASPEELAKGIIFEPTFQIINRILND